MFDLLAVLNLVTTKPKKALPCVGVRVCAFIYL